LNGPTASEFFYFSEAESVSARFLISLDFFGTFFIMEESTDKYITFSQRAPSFSRNGRLSPRTQ